MTPYGLTYTKAQALAARHAAPRHLYGMAGAAQLMARIGSREQLLCLAARTIMESYNNRLALKGPQFNKANTSAMTARALDSVASLRRRVREHEAAVRNGYLKGVL